MSELVEHEERPWRETFWEVVGVVSFAVALLIGKEMGRPELSLDAPSRWPLYWLQGTMAAGAYGVVYCVNQRGRWKISPTGSLCVLIGSFGWFVVIFTPLVTQEIYLYSSLPFALIVLFTRPFGLSRALPLYLAAALVGLDFLLGHRSKELWHLAYFAIPVAGLINEWRRLPKEENPQSVSVEN